MADAYKILQGSYKGYPLAIRSGSLKGGRDIVMHAFPGRDTQLGEDIRLIPRSFSLEIELRSRDYFGYRDGLLSTLDSKGTGDLIHPLYGRITDVVSTTYNLNENFTEFGSSVVSVNFERSVNKGVPQTSASEVTQIAAKNKNLQSSIITNISNGFNATIGTFRQGVEKINSVIDRAKTATNFIGAAAGGVNALADDIGYLSANVNSLVRDPLALATSFSNLFQSVNGLYASTDATFKTMVGFFDFGSSNSGSRIGAISGAVEVSSARKPTASTIQRDINDKVINGAVLSSSLGHAYTAAVQLDFDTTRAIDETLVVLDEGFNILQSSEYVDQDVRDEIAAMRVLAIQSMDKSRITASNIISVYTNPTTARLLGFNYYGDDTQGEIIAELNGISDVSFIQGDFEIAPGS